MMTADAQGSNSKDILKQFQSVIGLDTQLEVITVFTSGAATMTTFWKKGKKLSLNFTKMLN